MDRAVKSRPTYPAPVLGKNVYMRRDWGQEEECRRQRQREKVRVKVECRTGKQKVRRYTMGSDVQAAHRDNSPNSFALHW